MRTVAILLLSIAAISCAEEKRTDNQPEQKKRLSSVTWDLKAHKLVWVVQKGTVQGGEFVAQSSDKYEISPDDAMMAVAEEKRGFTPEEAASLHKLLDTLSLYCAESVVWWDEGQGTKLDPNAPSKDRNLKPEQKSEEKPGQKVDDRAEPRAPESRFPELMVAQARTK